MPSATSRVGLCLCSFFFNDTATTEIYTLSLHDALPIFAATLHRSIEDRTARLTIVGQGYVGLPLAVEFARAGFTVSGLDADLDRVVALNLGRSCTPDVTNEELAALLKDGRYEATVDGGVLERSDVVIICVPTPLRKSKDPDISAVVAAAETTAARVHRDRK